MDTQTFVYQGTLFDVTKESDGKFVADIAITNAVNSDGFLENTARVVGRFNSEGEAITAAKNEISMMSR